MKRTYTYRKFWLFFGILFCQSLHAQVKNVGPVLSYQKTNAGIEGKTSSAIFEVRAYNDNTIRVRVSRKHSFDNFSYALVSTEFPVFNSNVIDKGKTIEIATKDITVVVEKVPAFRVRFLNRAGQVINEDVAGDGFGTTFIGDKVS